MSCYERNYEFHTDNVIELEKDLHYYFQYYNFKKEKQGSDKFTFYKKGTILDEWRLNPLQWESKVHVDLTETNEVSINYTVYGNEWLTPKAFTSLFDTFLKNLDLFVTQKTDFKKNNQLKINSAQKQVAQYIVLIVLGAMIGFFAGYVVSTLTGGKLFVYAGGIIGTIIVQNRLNKRLIRCNTLPQRIS